MSAPYSQLANQVAQAAEPDYKRYYELFKELEQLVRARTELTLRASDFGREIEVRGAGMATYSHSLLDAVEHFVDINVAQVTNKIAGQGHDANQAAKTIR